MVEIKKNKTEIIRVKKSEYKGKEFVDCRIFYEKDGEYLPTKKGISFNPGIAKEVIEAILSVMEEKWI